MVIAASGSSRHAGLAGEIMLEDLAGLAVDVEYATASTCYRSTHTLQDPGTIVISQSGETADTLAALREAKSRGLDVGLHHEQPKLDDGGRGRRFPADVFGGGEKLFPRQRASPRNWACSTAWRCSWRACVGA